MREYVNKFYSINYIRKNVLKQNDREIEKMAMKSKKKLMMNIIQSPMAQVIEVKKIMSEETKNFIDKLINNDNAEIK